MTDPLSKSSLSSSSYSRTPLSSSQLRTSSSVNIGEEGKDVHSLTLKVMRLSKPSFQNQLPIYSERNDIASVLPSKMNAFGLSPLLTLPHTFQNIFLGETFTSYVSIHNHSPFDVKNVTVKTELQTATQRFNLSEMANPISNFQSGESHDYIVSHEVKEVGDHILICTVNYTKHSGSEPIKPLRKLFKFKVTNPITIKMQTHDLQFGIFLTAQIQNSTSNPLYLETVRFEPIALYNATDLNVDESQKQSNGSNVAEMIYMKPNDVRQYLFRLEPKHDPRAKIGTVIGKLELSWKSNLGDSGRLQTAPLERKLVQQAELELVARKIPTQITLEEPFDILCELSNSSDSSISPKISFVKESMTGILAHGINGKLPSVLPSGSTLPITLSFFPTKPGVQKISGITISDSSSSKIFEFNNFLDVFVETP
eukprot:TRINITY_DN5697_c0_g1_i3.p1 TRINITY_DN5697_c0_g1~~TRINITY_DN5697_c0_g1_i3.p1  ORF type:complete len:425 (-),score=111.81 TRINITY_DN5697_c0_g1_i3:3-1277(-)